MDHVSSLADNKIAIEPCEEYHDHLKKKGFMVFSSVEDSIIKWNEKVDYAFCFSVIEHVQNPRAFLSSIKDMLKHLTGVIYSWILKVRNTGVFSIVLCTGIILIEKRLKIVPDLQA